MRTPRVVLAPNEKPDAVDRALVLRAAFDRALRSHEFPVSFAWRRTGVEKLAVTVACISCGATALAEITHSPDKPHAPDVDVEALLGDAERSALRRLQCPHRPDKELSLDLDDASDAVRERYEDELVALIAHAVEAHNAHYQTLHAAGIPIALSWQVRREDFVYLSLSCACLACAQERREHQCNDRLRISETDAPMIDGILATEERSSIAYLVRVGCSHLGIAVNARSA